MRLSIWDRWVLKFFRTRLKFLGFLETFFQNLEKKVNLRKRQVEWDDWAWRHNSDVERTRDACYGLTGNHLETMQQCLASSERHLEYFLNNTKRPTE